MAIYVGVLSSGMTGGSVIRQFRKAAGVSQEQLARDIEASTPWVVQVESGRIANPSRVRLEAVDAALHADGAILRAYGWSVPGSGDGQRPAAADVGVPADLGEMLTEILSEIRTHRRSDIAPTARLADMPTRAELKAEVANVTTLGERLESKYDAVMAALGEHGHQLDAAGAAIEKAAKAVTRLDQRLGRIERRLSAVERTGSPDRPVADSGARKR